MKILVIGGTRFFGIPMVEALIKQGHDITIATRGNSKQAFYENTDHVILDRTDEASVISAIHYNRQDSIQFKRCEKSP